MDGVRSAERDAGGLPFTDAARRLLADAQEESGRLRHEAVGTEHLALALARRSADAPGLAGLGGVAGLGVDWARMRARIDETVTPGRFARAPAEPPPYTSRTRRVFALAGEGARALGHARVGVEHLVLGLVRERMGVGAQVLAEHGRTEQAALVLAQRTAAGGGWP